MAIIDLVPPNTMNMVNETLKRTQQVSSITQLVDRDGAFNAGNMLQQTGVLSIIQDVMQDRVDVINTLPLKTVVETTGVKSTNSGYGSNSW
jgi:hypothetical protein